jgi:dihydroxyacid dehydratase/phosphogluconate dehydratase
LFKNVIVAVLFSIKIKIPMQQLKSYISLYIEGGLIEERWRRWMKPEAKAQSGLLFKYAQSVKSASEGCVTDETHHEAFQHVLPCQI